MGKFGPGEFSSNPNQTHLKKPINVFKITRKFQVGVLRKDGAKLYRTEVKNSSISPYVPVCIMGFLLCYV